MSNDFLYKQYEMLSDYREKDSEMEWQDITDFRISARGISENRDTVRKGSKLLFEYLDGGWKLIPPTNDDFNVPKNKNTIINSDGSTTSEATFEVDDENKFRDNDYLLKLHKYDPNIFELVSAKSSIWEVHCKSGETKTLCSSKITIKPISEVSVNLVKDILIENCKNYKKSEPYPIKVNSSGKILEVNICDTHLGKLAWSGETGENYDYKIACNRFKYIISDILEQSKHLEFEKIYFIWSNDFYHFDTIDTKTTAGTPQDSDLRWQKMFRIGVELLVWAIDILSKKAPVETFYIASNHDTQTSYYATNYLYAWYNENPNVTVSYDCIGRKYVEYGNTMIGFCHGSEEGKNINNIMSKEKPEMFGRTKFRYMHAAHFHSLQGKDLIEENGCIVRYLGSPTSTDGWHYRKGYLGSVKSGYGFVYDKELGQRLEITSNIL